MQVLTNGKHSAGGTLLLLCFKGKVNNIFAKYNVLIFKYSSLKKFYRQILLLKINLKTN